MIQNLNTADKMIKLLLAVSVVLLYLLGIISGPEATLLMIMGCILIGIFIVKTIIDLSKKN